MKLIKTRGTSDPSLDGGKYCCDIITRSGVVYDGKILSTSPSIHVFGEDEYEEKRYWSARSSRLDERDFH